MFSSHLGSWRRTGTIIAGEDLDLLPDIFLSEQAYCLVQRPPSLPASSAAKSCRSEQTLKRITHLRSSLVRRDFEFYSPKQSLEMPKEASTEPHFTRCCPSWRLRGASTSARKQGNILSPHFPSSVHRQPCPESGGIPVCIVWLGCSQPRALNSGQQVRNVHRHACLWSICCGNSFGSIWEISPKSISLMPCCIAPLGNIK